MITSTANPRVKEVLSLREPRARRRLQLCTVEGKEEIRFAFESGARIITLFYADTGTGFSKDDSALMESMRAAGVELIELSPRVLARLSYREHPEPYFALARAPDTALERFDKALETRRSPQRAEYRKSVAGTQSPGNSVIVLDAVEKPGNIGAVLRSIDAAGHCVNGLIACACKTDLANPNIIRASKGAVFTVPAAECGAEELLPWLKERGYFIYALDPNGGDIYFDHDFYAQFQKTPNAAFIFGAEAHGLSPLWLEHADARLTIPMAGRVNSLNIAQAVTLLIYEVMQQEARREAGKPDR